MTPHIEAKKGEIAKTVLMPGDPLRAKYIAENFLENVKLVNKVRNIFAYTGTYKGKEITVMASGMGMPSMGIYAYELYKVYEVENIIRIGSCGGYGEDLQLFDTILAESSYSEGNFAYTFNSEDCHLAEASKELNEIIENVAKEQNIKYVKGNVLCSDCFDLYIPKLQQLLDRIPKDIIAAEMESFALFYLANYLNKKAACLLTVVDIPTKQNQVSAEDREKALKDMIILALESSLKL
ncbi:MAG: purine-nucleoside phosphorylase [Clostridia bacterium]|nr:purine-nucleoside phosphorylase [Clostridia bacterium]